MSEQDHVQLYVIAVPTFGEPERMRDLIQLEVARALHHRVRPGSSVAPARPLAGMPEGNYRIDGPPKVLDPKGDDSGHHPGHDLPLLPIEVRSFAAPPR